MCSSLSGAAQNDPDIKVPRERSESRRIHSNRSRGTLMSYTEAALDHSNWREGEGGQTGATCAFRGHN